MTVTTEPRPSQGDVVGRTRPRRGRLRREVISRDETARLSASIIITPRVFNTNTCHNTTWVSVRFLGTVPETDVLQGWVLQGGKGGF